MKNSKKKLYVIIPVLLCIVLLIGAGVGYFAYQRWCENTYTSEIFGSSYRITFNLYSQIPINATYSSDPVYFLSNDGKLFYATRENMKYKAKVLTGHMEKVELTDQNFDNRLNDDNWVASGISISSARENNKETWYYRGKDGDTYYVMLQDNGAVFLCKGHNGGISEILRLDQKGDRDTFYDYIDNMNAMLR